MDKNILNIIALIFLCVGAFCIFWKRDIFKEKASSWITTTSGFVVSCIALIVIYFVNR